MVDIMLILDHKTLEMDDIIGKTVHITMKMDDITMKMDHIMVASQKTW
jgi:hypothetical protein